MVTDYLNPELKPGLALNQMPVRLANEESLQGFGCLVQDDPNSFPIEIVRWPAQGWRPVDEDSGDEGGTTSGTFVSQWKGDILFGSNSAVGGEYVLGYGVPPEDAQEDHSHPPHQIMMWHANYHPDGGQLFFPKSEAPFLVPLALPGDNVQPDDFVCFCFDGSCGLYIHPNIWHEGVFALDGRQEFYDRQGAVHARVSVHLPNEFDCLLTMNIAEAKRMLQERG